MSRPARLPSVLFSLFIKLLNAEQKSYHASLRNPDGLHVLSKVTHHYARLITQLGMFECSLGTVSSC